MATRMFQTIGETAKQIRRCLVAGDKHEALRWVTELVVAFERTSPTDRPHLLADEPPSTGDLRWDAMLAGVAEQLCFDNGLAVPAWSLQPSRFLDHWWFVTPYRSLHASAFVTTPPALANRGVFIHAASLESV